MAQRQCLHVDYEGWLCCTFTLRVCINKCMCCTCYLTYIRVLKRQWITCVSHLGLQWRPAWTDPRLCIYRNHPFLCNFSHGCTRMNIKKINNNIISIYNIIKKTTLIITDYIQLSLFSFLKMSSITDYMCVPVLTTSPLLPPSIHYPC